MSFDLTPRLITALSDLPLRPADAHKGTFGRVVIIAGSRGMTGAAALSGMAALRGGAGLVTVATPATVAPIIAGYEPSYMTWPVCDVCGQLSMASLSELMDRLATADAAAIGPGIGQSKDIDELVAELYRMVEIPLVIDADGLNALSHRSDAFGTIRPAAARVLTPHPGEFARLSGLSMETIAGNREAVAAAFAAQQGVVVVLKGQHTVITDGEQLAINPTGNSGMATGGSGDVLTGILTALLARRMDPFAAAQLATYLHGLAGDLAAADVSQPGLIASDLPRYIAQAWKRLGQ
ncbi:MAG: NAD(P)H-hydrate dehydratase [Planctomycetaceae bacterium]|nr:NAD(P)H-hydrate dehydratase [Planctomycetaceae bacterium]